MPVDSPAHRRDVADRVQDAKYDDTVFEPKQGRTENGTNDSRDETDEKSSNARAPTQRRRAYNLKQCHEVDMRCTVHKSAHAFGVQLETLRWQTMKSHAHFLM